MKSDKKPVPAADSKRANISIGVRPETHARHDVLKAKFAKEVGLRWISWDSYMTLVAQKLEQRAK